MIKHVRAVGSGHWRSQCRPMRSIGKYSGALPRSLKNQAANDKSVPVRSIGITRAAFGPDVGARYYYEKQIFQHFFSQVSGAVRPFGGSTNCNRCQKSVLFFCKKRSKRKLGRALLCLPYASLRGFYVSSGDTLGRFCL